MDLVGVPGNMSVALSWKPPQNSASKTVVDYVVEYSSTDKPSWTIFEDAVSQSTSATVTGLRNGTAYSFKVSTITSDGPGGYAEIRTNLTPYGRPVAPTNLQGTAGNSHIALSWNAPSDNGGRPISDYLIQLSTDGGSSWEIFNDGVSVNTSVAVTGLSNDQTYSFRVSAANAAGLSEPATTTETFTPFGPPSAPTSVSFNLQNKEISLTWQPPRSGFKGTITDYVIEHAVTTEGPWTKLNDGVSVNTSAIFSNLINSNTHAFRVAAETLAGIGDFSEPLLIQIDGAITSSGDKVFVHGREIKLPVSVYAMGGGMNFVLQNGNWFKFESIGYDRGIIFSKWDGSINTYFKVATITNSSLTHTFSARSAIDKFLADNLEKNLKNIYVSIELAMVDANGILIAYTNGNNTGIASPLKSISDSLTITAGEHPNVDGINVANSWMGGCVGGKGSYQAPWCTETTPPMPLKLFDKVTLLTDDYRFTVVGDAGNTGDSLESYEPLNPASSRRAGFGAVSYQYAIGKHLVTMEDYAEFLNSVAQSDTQQLFKDEMTTDLKAGGITRSGLAGSYRYQVIFGKSKRPVTYVSWLNAARFINWLHNGRPVGDLGPSTTESGVYNLTSSLDYADYPRSSAANYFMPHENEWYKAAYYKGGGTNAGYWRYATQRNEHPVASSTDGGAPNRANFNGVANGTTDVGLFTSSPSAYGTFDQTGNVWQWMEDEGPIPGQKARRGGSWENTDSTSPSRLSAEVRSASPISAASQHVGFRVGKRLPATPN